GITREYTAVKLCLKNISDRINNINNNIATGINVLSLFAVLSAIYFWNLRFNICDFSFKKKVKYFLKR
ncbi:MAG: hypothetical protein J7K64_07560, partial [Bacteroidales bacterium]|nr:hypothetical protein [Bacteroidales bacterium]